MKKRYLYPIWKLDKLDSELTKMEQNGFRLNKVTPFRTFHFVQSKPKDVKYFTTYNMSRERSMVSIEHSLKEKGANKVCTINVSIGIAEIYRITNNLELTDKIQFRNIYLQHVIMTKFLICLFYCIVALACFIFELCFNNSGVFGDVFITLILVTATSLAIHNLCGFIFLKKQYKNIFSEKG